MSPQEAASVESSSPRAEVALGISGLAVALYVVAMMVAENGGNEWLWPVAGLVGGAGALTGWRVRPRSGKAVLAMVLGGLVFLTIVVWIIWAASTGNF